MGKRRGLRRLGCTNLFFLIALALAFTAEFLQFDMYSTFLFVVIVIAAAVLTLVISLDF